MAPADRDRLHALLDEAIDGEPEIVGVVILVETPVGGGEIKIRAVLDERAQRLREFLGRIRG